MTKICNWQYWWRELGCKLLAHSVTITLFLFVTIAFAYSATTNSLSSLIAWLNSSHIPTTIITALQNRIANDYHAHEWLVEQNQQVYALVYQEIPARTLAQIQQMQRNQVEGLARNLLLLYAAGEYYQQRGFTSREAIAKALSNLETVTQGKIFPGLQSQSTVLDNHYVAALVWIDTKRIISYRQNPPTIEIFLPAYCQALYPTAQALFQDRRYKDALFIYKDMYKLSCRQPNNYFLDAAECFLAITQPEDAKRMASYLLNEQSALLTSNEAERAGDILFKVGDEIKAQQAYALALSKLHTIH